jgi:hypothetical protein
VGVLGQQQFPVFALGEVCMLWRAGSRWSEEGAFDVEEGEEGE